MTDSISMTEHDGPSDIKGCGAAPADAIEQLNEIFAAYNDTTDRMRDSYRLLQQEVVRLREELEHKNEQLERKSRLAALGEMAAGMAHEIRNPLGALQLYASLLGRDLANQPEQKQWVEKISVGVRSLDRIVSDILSFTHDQQCCKASVALLPLVNEVVDYVRPQAQAGGVTIELAGIGEELVVEIDADMMRRVFLNLLLNAVEAVGENGKVTVVAEPYLGEPEYQFRICISDTGAGMARSVMNKIFNPFFTTKDSGTGLGLAIVHRLVECHGGVITAANGSDGGAVFTILLP